MNWKYFVAAIGLSAIMLSGCATRDAAQLGAMVGRTIGTPIGAVATALDETVQTAADVVKQNPRYEQSNRQPAVRALKPPGQSNSESYYYRTEVLVKTRGPANIESLTLQKTEDVSDFWR